MQASDRLLESMGDLGYSRMFMNGLRKTVSPRAQPVGRAFCGLGSVYSRATFSCGSHGSSRVDLRKLLKSLRAAFAGFIKNADRTS